MMISGSSSQTAGIFTLSAGLVLQLSFGACKNFRWRKEPNRGDFTMSRVKYARQVELFSWIFLLLTLQRAHIPLSLSSISGVLRQASQSLTFNLSPVQI